MAYPESKVEQPVPAPDFELPRFEGGVFRLSDQKTSCTALVFIRSGGHFVERALDAIDDVAASAPVYRTNVLMVCISSKADEKALNERFQVGATDGRGRPRSLGAKWVLLKDPTGSVHRQYHVIAVPTVVLVDRRGMLGHRFPNYSLKFGSEFRTQLRRCLDLPALTEATTATRHAMRYASTGDRMAALSMWTAALDSYESALKIDPTFHRARLAAAFCLLRTEKTEEAGKYLNMLRDTDAPTTSVKIGLAWVAALSGKPKEALTLLGSLGPNAAGQLEYLEAQAVACEATGEKEKAEEAREQAEALRRAIRGGLSPTRRQRTPSKK